MSGEPTPATPRARDPSERRSTAVATAGRISLGCGTLALLTGVALSVALESPPLSVQLIPLAASVVVLGLPHGAVDHLVLPRSRGDPVTNRSVAVTCGGYLALAAAYAAVWFFAPAVAFAGFVLLTIAHWGQGDVYALVALLGVDHLETRGQRLLAGVVRGGLPMLVPLVAAPDQYAAVAGATVGLFDPAAAAALDPAFDPVVRRLVGVGFAALVTLSLCWGLVRSGASRGWLLDAGETLGLAAFFAVVPPILAVGLYFALWHSVRHVLRTLLVDAPAAAALEEGDVSAAVRRFARDAAPFTAGGLVVLAGLALVVPRTPATLPSLLGVYLVCLAVLTLPHAVVVSLLDRRQGVWTAHV
ncbi:Brp/Blh family beta-carotene 15,15'-dioxygenase [Halopiger goleimassiliensis]|uniref:Brp/Blh family beta-carotene 15,15'-dioxygenase n=1 Tax=Halopiger goleimassiliensis TaxID=1293048 RepID=UPI0006781ED3|nr:Brp/Blh family beta-carotene 15,15'-dioxygenase [Halopiger goleimassiliensis]